MEWVIYATTSDKARAIEIAGRLIREESRRAAVLSVAGLDRFGMCARSLHEWAVIADARMESPGLKHWKVLSGREP